MLRRVAFIKNDVSEERIASTIRVTRIDELETTLAEETSSSKTFVHTRATLRNIREDVIPHSHGSENLKTFIHSSNPSYEDISRSKYVLV
jgi:hypothetical protein